MKEPGREKKTATPRRRAVGCRQSRALVVGDVVAGAVRAKVDPYAFDGDFVFPVVFGRIGDTVDQHTSEGDVQCHIRLDGTTVLPQDGGGFEEGFGGFDTDVSDCLRFYHNFECLNLVQK